MKRPALFSLALAIGLTALAIHQGTATAPAAPRDEKPLAHMVFFTLKDRTEAARADLVALCEKYLSDHDGVQHYSVGVIAEDVEEPVSVRDFDVALHLVFDDKEAADAYQKSDRHQKFVAEGRDSWEQVRVFDSYIAAD